MTVDLDELDPAVRELAFWLQDHIYRTGIDGIHFMEDTRLWAEDNAADVTAYKIRKGLASGLTFGIDSSENRTRVFLSAPPRAV